MDQISPPMRIVLAVAVVFLAAYMLVLKPKDETSTPAAAPATPPASASASDGNTASTGLGKAVEGARGAADATESAQDKSAAAGDETTGAANAPNTTSSAPTTSTKPETSSKAATPVDPSLAKLPKWLQKSIDHKVVAILFTNGTSADDRRTRHSLKLAFTGHGRVVKRSVPLSRIARYRPVAQGVDVQQSPTLMVIDRKRVAQSLVGYSSLGTINQTIIDGLLGTDVPVKHVKYLQTVRAECRDINRQSVIGENAGTSFKGQKANLDANVTTIASSLGTLRNAPVPAKYRPLSKQVNRYVAAELAISRRIRSEAVGSTSIDTKKANSIARSDRPLERQTLLELNAVGVASCN